MRFVLILPLLALVAILSAEESAAVVVTATQVDAAATAWGYVSAGATALVVILGAVAAFLRSINKAATVLAAIEWLLAMAKRIGVDPTTKKS